MSEYYCKFKDCKTIPSYGVIGTKEAIYCIDHKKVEHIDIRNKLCLECNKRPSYGVIGTKEAIYCVDHKEINHVNVVSKTCLKCDKQPAFGYQHAKAIYCVDHKEINHVNVVTKTCLICDKIPTYGIKGTNIPLYCKNHKEKDHVDIKHKMCLNCDKRASFGIKYTKLALYCKNHKETDHVDVMNKICVKCNKRPTYGVRGTKEAICCFIHKEIGHVDITHKTCKFENCYIRASYGFLFKSKTHCKKHKNNNEFIKNNPKCEFEKCKNQPCYTDENNYPLRCEDHKKEGDKNIIERQCSSCGLNCMLTEDNLCNDCNDYSERKHHKRKETIIKNVLDANNFKYDTYDKIPSEACNKFRPDFVFDRGTYIIILEVDENQHQSYTCECEQARMINLFQDFGGLPVVFVRFNPDGYTDNNCIRHQYTKSRETRLLSTLNSLMLHQPKDFLSVIYLYYNGDDGINKVTNIKYESNNINDAEIIFV